MLLFLIPIAISLFFPSHACSVFFFFFFGELLGDGDSVAWACAWRRVLLLADELTGRLHARVCGGVCERGGPEVLCRGGPGALGVQEEFERTDGECGGDGLYSR